METQKLSINPSCWPPSYLPNGPGRISALLTYLGGRQQGPLHCQTCVHYYISRQRKRWEVGNAERGENSLEEARGKSKGSCDTTPLNLSFLSVRKPDHPHWGCAHLLLLTTQITPSEPSISQLAGEVAWSSSSPTLFGEGSHPPLWLQLSNRRNAKSSESLPALSLSVTCIKPPTHTKIFITSAQNQLMRCIPYEVVNKSYVDFATLLSLELIVMNCNGTGMPRYFACLSMLQLLRLMNFCTWQLNPVTIHWKLSSDKAAVTHSGCESQSMWQAKEQLANTSVQCNQQLKCSWKQYIVGIPGSAFRGLCLEIKLKDT